MRSAILLLGLASIVDAQMLTAIVSGGAPVSNIVLLSSTACNNGATNADYACAIPSTTAGSLLVIVQNDALNPAAPSVPTDVTGSTCVSHFTSAQVAGEGRSTIFSCPNISAGITSVSIHRASGNSAVNVREYSGMALASPLDVVVSTMQSNVAATAMTSNTVTATQTVLAVGWCSTGSTGTAGMGLGGDWTNGENYPETAAATDSYAGDIINGLRGQFTFMATGTSRNYGCGVATFKSAVPGNNPTGNKPSSYSDFENSTDGTTISAAILAAGTHAGTCVWTIPGTAAQITVSTSAEKSITQDVVTNGVNYTAPVVGTRGLRYNPGAAANTLCTWGSTTPGTVSIGFWWKAPAAQDSVPYSFGGINGAGAGDYIAAQLLQSSNDVILEALSCGACASPTITLPALDAWYLVTMQYVQNGTHSLAIYNSAGVQVGSNVTQLANGNVAPVAAYVGQSHGDPGTPGNYYYFDSFLIDYRNGVFPLVP